MEEIKPELRMYFFVPYNIMPIQKGIQAGHCAEQYAYKYRNDPEWEKYVTEFKTWIILNGGTMNDSPIIEVRGSMDQLLDQVKESGIKYATFNEPDLNNGLSAICFICDEKVFDKKNYPYYEDWAAEEIYNRTHRNGVRLGIHVTMPDEPTDEYIELIGGEQNMFKKELIRNQRLAV